MQLSVRFIVVCAAIASFVCVAHSTYCRSPSSPTNGYHSGRYGRYFRLGHIIKYRCNTGYKLQGYSKTTCLYNRYRRSYYWSRPAPRCIRVVQVCPRIDDGPENGKVKYSSAGRVVGAKVWYSCNAGHKLVGSESRKCLSNLKWYPAAPVCKAQNCGRPEVCENCIVKYRSISIGSKSWYSCKPGFTLVGRESRVCSSGLMWTPDVPICRPTGCERLINPNNGHVLHNGTSIGSYAKYFCDDGFYLVGNRFRKCVETGWTGEDPICKPITCDELEPLKYGKIFLSNRSNFGSVATYVCFRGYELGEGDKKRVCQASGNWSGTAPTCTRNCPALSNPSRGKVVLTGTSAGSTATYTCSPGYKVVGDSIRTCSDAGIWSGRAPICRRIFCDKLIAPSYGFIRVTGFVVGSTAKYFCKSGFELVGAKIRTCQQSGDWTDESPICRRIVRCDKLSAPTNGAVTQPGNSVGTEATYTCDDGFALVGEDTRTCQDDGEWSGDEPTCELIVTCDDLIDPANGDVFHSGNSVGTEATYTCDDGFFLIGEDTRICQDDGEWSGDEPICELIITCDDLSDPSGGNVDQNGNTPGAQATYSCFEGYLLNGEDTRTCQDDGEWSGDEPTCELIITCDDLSDPSGGNVDQNGNTPGAQATYSCFEGYLLNGEDTRTCQDDGEWSGDEPTCELIITCDDLSDPSGGNVDQNGNTPGAQATYSCFEGYLLNGEDTRTCQDNGQWSGDEPTCELIITCDDLSDPSGGNVDQNGNTPGAQATYSCFEGYMLNGEDTRTCQDNGQWSGDEPTCELIITCDDLSDPSGGNVDQNGNTPGAQATYSCFEGYMLNGEDTRTCQDNGQWSGDEPTCELIITCDDLLDPTGGNVDQNGNTPGAQATYSCFEGYMLNGEDTRTCQDDGEWSGDEPTCELIITCDDLSDPSGGKVDQNGNTPGAQATYSCFEGYMLNGEDTRTCQDDGEWSGDEPTCRFFFTCMDLEHPANGAVSQPSNAVGTVALYSCNDGFVLDGDPTRTCQDDGQWSGRAPTCILPPEECVDLVDPVGGNVDQVGNSAGFIATYSCFDGYVLVGEDTRTCQDDGQWSGDEPICELIITCDDLLDPTGGNVDQNGNTPGAQATYSCFEGYLLNGEDTRTCQDNGQWSGDEPICELIITCDDLSDPSGGNVDQNGNTPGAQATYSCFEGYLLNGEDTRTCQDDGQWSGDEPTCELIITCDDLSDPSGGNVDQNGNTPGAQATYSCFEGYLLNGEDTRTCQDDGQWSGDEPTCELIITCDDLSDPSGGNVDQNGNTPGAQATYSCFEGYLLNGEDTRTCQDDGQWSGDEPICELIITCDNLLDPTGGIVDQNGNTPGAQATYSCFEGYMLNGEDTRTCQDDGEWSGDEPICELIITCDDLSDPSGGNVDQNGNTPGAQATYSCFEGYLLNGEDTRTCQDNGQWSGDEPICELIITCDDLSDPSGGNVDQNGNTPGAQATYSCFEGYLLNGEDTRTCQDNGQWSGDEPICERVITCGSLSDPAQGAVTLSGTTVGSIATYICIDGYEISGVEERTCQSNGEWSDSEPICIPVQCGNLLNPRGGRVDLTGTTVSSTATYSCNDGYFIVGDVTRVCQNDGAWSGEAPICEPVLMCDDLPDPVNGMVMLMGRTPGSSAMYTCVMGYMLQGDTVRTCQSDGEWSGEEPICISVDCDQLDDPTNGDVTLSGTSLGSVATYICDTGYTLNGEQERTCQMDRTWSGEAPTCVLVDCGTLEDPLNGAVEFTTGTTTYLSIAAYTCNIGYTLTGVTARQCLDDGQWSEEEPFCTPVDCLPLLPPLNGDIKVTATTLGSVARYNCFERFILVGNFIRICLINGLWSGTTPLCEEVIPVIQCPILNNPANGQVTITGREPFSTATYVCDLGYILFGDDIRTCSETGEWSKDEPTCQPIDCGPLGNPVNGRVDVFNTTLGSPADYRCNQGYDLVGVSRRVCVETGDWSDDEPECIPVECPQLNRPENGLLTLTGLTFGSTATYACNSGYVLSGNQQRTCLSTGFWSGSDPICIVPPPGCGDPGTLDNGRRIGDDFSSGAVVFFRCFDDFDLIGSKFRVCQESGVWSNSIPTCVPFNDTCSSSDIDVYDRCGRRCDCINGQLRNCCRFRKDYAGLTTQERQTYITTFLTAAQDPIYKPRYDALVALWKQSFDNNITQASTPSISQYFVFVRYFLLEYEDLLKDIDCTVSIPFYDWTPFPIAPYTAAVWSNTDGFGDTSRASDGCVITGPVRVGQFSVTPSAGSGCLQREYRNQRFPSRDIVDRDLLPLPSEEFSSFHRFLQLFIGLNVQCFVGGTLCGINAANDPVHLLHLARIDSLLTRWQLIGQGREEIRYSLDNSPLLLSPGFRVAQFSNNLNLPYDICVLYEPPVLLKNHAPAAAPLSLGFRAEITRMDCVPMSMMSFMDNMMTAEDHTFMEVNCNKPRVFRRNTRK